MPGTCVYEFHVIYHLIVPDLKSDLLLLAVNTLLKDLKDSNPTVRALALRTLCTVDHEAFFEHRLPCLLEGLKDSSAYVRRASSAAVLSISRIDVESLKEAGIVNKLYELIRDQDPIVVVNCVMSLEEILHAEGGIVLNKKIVAYLVQKVETFTTWGSVYMLKLLMKYQPKTEEETLDIMNVLDPFLENNCASLTVLSLEYFLQLIQTMPQLENEVVARCQNVFLNVLSSGNAEVEWCLMQFLHGNSHTNSFKNIFVEHFKSVICRQKDPVYLKIEKIKFVVTLVDKDNFTEILDELLMNSTSKDVDVSLCSIQMLKRLTLDWPDLSDVLLKAFIKLLKSDRSHVVSNTLQVLVSLPADVLTTLTHLGRQVCSLSRTLTDTRGQVAALYLAGCLQRIRPTGDHTNENIDDNAVDHTDDHADTHRKNHKDDHTGDYRHGHTDDLTEETVSVLEDYIERFRSLEPAVHTQLLHTSVQLFTARPATYQHLLGEVLHLCVQTQVPGEPTDTNVDPDQGGMAGTCGVVDTGDLAQQAAFYYSIMFDNTKSMKQIFM